LTTSEQLASDTNATSANAKRRFIFTSQGTDQVMEAPTTGNQIPAPAVLA
jgi:hypothetical protein